MKRRRRIVSLVLFSSVSACQAFVVAPSVTRLRQQGERMAAAAPTKLPVARVPDSVVEQFSTETLLDKILDESLRFSARKPIIMEVSATQTMELFAYHSFILVPYRFNSHAVNV